MKKVLMFTFLISMTISCLSKKDYFLLMEPPINDSNSDSFWECIDINDTPLSQKAVIDHIELCKKTGADSQIIVYKSKIVSEWYSKQYTEPIGAMSSTKVIASLLIGTLVDSGKLDYQSTVSQIIPVWTGGYRDEVRIIDLLTHTAGFNRRNTQDTSIGFAKGDKTEFVLHLTPENKPGTKFEYSNEGVQLLEPIIRISSGQDTEIYANKVLFQPLGMNNTQFYKYGGSPWLYAELRTTPRDLARLGVMMQNNGKWNGQQVVSVDYIEKATSPGTLFENMGYLWWILDKNKTVEGFYASGYLNTDIYVFKNHDVVIVRTQSPKNGFTGKPESKDYFKKAMPIFRRIVNE